MRLRYINAVLFNTFEYFWILSNMFFEPSTRTRISFGSAFNILGGEVRETTGIEATSFEYIIKKHQKFKIDNQFQDESKKNTNLKYLNKIGFNPTSKIIYDSEVEEYILFGKGYP